MRVDTGEELGLEALGEPEMETVSENRGEKQGPGVADGRGVTLPDEHADLEGKSVRLWKEEALEHLET